ncbi:universal stress protein [Oscillatoria sp. FACHB-1407]|nr:universal stress protein [Oscillatoria sp. FACHB-1407]
MAQLDSSGLHLPFLLATHDCYPSDSAYQWLEPIANRLAAQGDARPSCSILSISGQNASCLDPKGASDGVEEPALELQPERSLLPILQYAQTVQAGLLAVHWRAKTRLEPTSTDLGMAIARYATCPVLVLPDEQDASQKPSWDHALLVINASEAAKGAIAVTRQLVSAGIRRVTILCIHPPLNTHYLFGPFATPTPNWQLNQSLRQAQYDQSQSLARQAKNALHLADGDVQTLVQMSESGTLICSVAQQHRADVIILGSDAPKRLSLAHYHPKFRPDRLTPVAEDVIRHSRCPVLLCRAMSSPPTIRRFALPKLKLHTPATAKPR